MEKFERRNIEVYADWVHPRKPVLIGTLHTTILNREEIVFFEYDENWLKNNQSLTLDPSLQLSQLNFEPHPQNFCLFFDSSPDRWGRFLMQCYETQLAKQEGRSPNDLFESDYLLGVHDQYRTGALRFRTQVQRDFLNHQEISSFANLASLSHLEKASLMLEKNGALNHPNYPNYLQMLMATGASLGGARPKVSIADENNDLWIAKFPTTADKFDIGAWEMLVNTLAKKAGVIAAQGRLLKFNSPHHIFLSKRFDRVNLNQRIPFVSAISLLSQGTASPLINASYLALAEFLLQSGSQPIEDLEQLWRRIVFFICVSNTDDHLRNQGFILQPDGWLLSPAFDINPVPNGNGLTLNINENENAQDIRLALDVAKHFKLSLKRADKIITEVIGAVKEWRKEASRLNISSNEQEYMSRAFRVAENKQ